MIFESHRVSEPSGGLSSLIPLSLSSFGSFSASSAVSCYFCSSGRLGSI